MDSKTLAVLPGVGGERKWPWGESLDQIQLEQLKGMFRYYDAEEGFNTEFSREESYPQFEKTPVIAYYQDVKYVYALEVIKDMTSYFVPVRIVNSLSDYTLIMSFEPDIATQVSLKGPKTGLKGENWKGWRHTNKWWGKETFVSYWYGDDDDVGQWRTMKEMIGLAYSLLLARLKDTWDTILRIPNQYINYLNTKQGGLDFKKLVGRDVFSWNILNTKDGLTRLVERARGEVVAYEGQWDILDVIISPTAMQLLILRPENRDFYLVGHYSDGPRGAIDKGDFNTVSKKSIFKLDPLRIKKENMNIPEIVVVRGAYWVQPTSDSTIDHTKFTTRAHSLRIADFTTGTIEEISTMDCIDASYDYGEDGEIMSAVTLFETYHHSNAGETERDDLLKSGSFFTEKATLEKPAGDAKQYFSQCFTNENGGSIKKQVHNAQNATDAFYKAVMKHAKKSEESDGQIWSDFIDTIVIMKDWVGDVVFPDFDVGQTFPPLGFNELANAKPRGVLGSLWGLLSYAKENMGSGDPVCKDCATKIKIWADYMMGLIKASKTLISKSFILEHSVVFESNDDDEVEEGIMSYENSGDFKKYIELDHLLRNTILHSPKFTAGAEDGRTSLKTTNGYTQIRDNHQFSGANYIDPMGQIDTLVKFKKMYLHKKLQACVADGVVEEFSGYGTQTSSERLLAMIYLFGKNTRDHCKRLAQNNVGLLYKFGISRPNEQFVCDMTMFLGRGGSTAECQTAFQDTRFANSHNEKGYKMDTHVAFGTKIVFEKNFADFHASLIKKPHCGGSAKFSTKVSTGSNLMKKWAIMNQSIPDTSTVVELFVFAVPLDWELRDTFMDISKLYTEMPSSDHEKRHTIPDWNKFNMIWNLDYNAKIDVLLPYRNKNSSYDVEKSIKQVEPNFFCTSEPYQVHRENKWVTVIPSVSRNLTLSDQGEEHFMKTWLTGDLNV